MASRLSTRPTLAKGYADGKTVATDIVETTTSPARIQLTADRTSLNANAEDAVVMQVAILDDKGRVVPDASNRVTFQVTGGGEF